MTKEELEKEAREDVDNLNGVDLVSATIVAIDKYGAYKLGRYDGYLASAEPREKRIAELEDKLANADYQLEGRDNEIREFEKENKVLAQNLEDTEIINAELKNKLKEKLKTIADKDLSFVARFDALEKENAELKDDNKVMADNYSKMEQKFYDQLTKATEIIKKLIEAIHIWDCKNLEQVEAEAEQFLNSEVEK